MRATVQGKDNTKMSQMLERSHWGRQAATRTRNAKYTTQQMSQVTKKYRFRGFKAIGDWERLPHGVQESHTTHC